MTYIISFSGMFLLDYWGQTMSVQNNVFWIVVRETLSLQRKKTSLSNKSDVICLSPIYSQ